MFYPKNCWKPTPNVQCHWKDGKQQESHLHSEIKISLPKLTSSPEVFIKCRKKVLVLLGLSFSREPSFFLSKHFQGDLLHNSSHPRLVPLSAPSTMQIQTRGFPENHGCQSLHKAPWVLLPSWQFLLHFKADVSQGSSACFSSWQYVTQLCLHAWITHWPAWAVLIYPHHTNRK